MTVSIKLFTKGAFPKLSRLGDEIDLELRLMSVVHYGQTKQSLTSGDVVCVQTAASHEQDKYFAVLDFARTVPAPSPGGPRLLTGLQAILGKVHHEKCYVCLSFTVLDLTLPL